MNGSPTFQILLIMSHSQLVSSLVDVLVNGDEVASDGTPEDSPLPLRKVRCSCDSLFNILEIFLSTLFHLGNTSFCLEVLIIKPQRTLCELTPTVFLVMV